MSLDLTVKIITRGVSVFNKLAVDSGQPSSQLFEGTFAKQDMKNFIEDILSQFSSILRNLNCEPVLIILSA